MAKGKTRAEFIDAMHQAEVCYIYFLDKSECMHFVADEEHDEGFCTSLADAFMADEKEAEAIKALCNLLFPEHVYHIVKMRTTVVWI